MPANTAIPFFRLGKDVTGLVTGDSPVRGKRFVKYVVGGRGSAPAIAPAGAGERPAGIAGHDQEVGGYVHVLHGGVNPVVAGEDLIANDDIAVGADGTAVKAVEGDYVVGVAVANAPKGSDAPIHFAL